MTLTQWFIGYEILGILLITALSLFCRKFEVRALHVFIPGYKVDVFDWIFAVIVVQFWFPIIGGFVINELLMTLWRRLRTTKGMRYE